MAGRPRTFDVDAATEALLMLFWRRGYDQVSQQQMAAAAGLSTSSLYNTFGTKAETFDRVMRRYGVLADELTGPLRDGTAGTDDLLAFTDRLRAQLDGPNGAAGCLVATSMAVLAGREIGAQQVADHLRSRRDAFHQALRRARRLGEPVPDPAHAASLVLAATLGIFATARATAAGREAHDQLDALRDLIESWQRETE